MSKIQEIETRSYLTEEQYIAICSTLLRQHPRLHFFEIENIYLDSDKADLESRGYFLRLRTTDNKYCELSLKVVISETEATEYTQEINLSDKHNLTENHILPDGEIKDVLKEQTLSMLTFIVVGSLRTKRLEVQREKNKIIVDSNVYGDEEIKDYDIEVEADSKTNAEKALKRISNTYKFTISTDYRTKYQRAVHH